MQITCVLCWGLKLHLDFFFGWKEGAKTPPVPVTLSHERIQMLKSSSIKRTSAVGKIASFWNRELVTVYLESVNNIVVCVCARCLRRKQKRVTAVQVGRGYAFTEWYKSEWIMKILLPCILQLFFFLLGLFFHWSFVYLDNQIPAGLSGTSRFFYSHHGVAQYSSSLRYKDPRSMHHTWIIKIYHRRSNTLELSASSFFPLSPSPPLLLSLSLPLHFIFLCNLLHLSIIQQATRWRRMIKLVFSLWLDGGQSN